MGSGNLAVTKRARAGVGWGERMETIKPPSEYRVCLQREGRNKIGIESVRKVNQLRSF